MKWINIEEQLPESYQPVIAQSPSKACFVAVYDNQDQCWRQIDTGNKVCMRIVKWLALKEILEEHQAPPVVVIKKEPLSLEQYNELKYELHGFQEVEDQIMDVYGLITLQDLPRDLYYKVANRIRELKRVMKDKR
jgi:hypothetical protein